MSLSRALVRVPPLVVGAEVPCVGDAGLGAVGPGVIFRLWAEDLQARAERVISSVVWLGGSYSGLTP
jgi:hypothetical protein